jgi:hypothetical protein
VSVKIQCSMCHVWFEAKSTKAKTCSNRCKLRKHRGLSPDPSSAIASVGTMSLIPPPELPADGSGASSDPSGTPEGLEMGCELTVRAELERYNRVNTVRGQIAIALARRIDNATAVVGFAALTKELDRALEAALAGVEVEADPIDEIRKRRDAKMGIQT